MIYPSIEGLLNTLRPEEIDADRKRFLHPLINYIKTRKATDQNIRLNFICTHNSRRSQLAQIWAQTIAHKFNLNNIWCYSGGTEATAMFPFVAETLREQGFEITPLSKEANPVYAIKFGESCHPVVAFSKTHDHPFNPSSDFAAILTCSQADEGCPFIAGAEIRIPVTYDDPKTFDGTPQQAEKYRECSLQIATELLYVFSKISI